MIIYMGVYYMGDVNSAWLWRSIVLGISAVSQCDECVHVRRRLDQSDDVRVS